MLRAWAMPEQVVYKAPHKPLTRGRKWAITAGVVVIAAAAVGLVFLIRRIRRLQRRERADQAADSTEDTTILNEEQALQIQENVLQSALQAFEATITSSSSALQAQITALQTRATTDEADITTDESNISTLQGQVATLQTHATTDEAHITTLQTNAATDETHITTLQSQVATLQSQVTTINTTLSAIAVELTPYSIICAQSGTLAILASNEPTMAFPTRTDAENWPAEPDPTIFTIPASGWYVVAVNAVFTTDGPAGTVSGRFLSINVDNGDPRRAVEFAAPTNDTPSIAISSILNLAAGDHVTMAIFSKDTTGANGGLAMLTRVHP